MAVDLGLRRGAGNGRGSALFSGRGCRRRGRDWLRLDGRRWSRRFGDSRSRGLLRRLLHGLGLLIFALLDRLFLQEAEDVVENEVAVGLLSQEEGLHKLPPGFALVGHLANDLDDDATVRRGLGIDRMDEHLAILEANRRDLVMDFLRSHELVSLSLFGDPEAIFGRWDILDIHCEVGARLCEL